MKYQLALTLFALLSASAFAQEYRLDDGSMERTLSILDPGESIGAMQAFTVPGGGQDTIHTLSFVSGSAPLGSPTWGNADGMDLSIAIWSDPNGDGNPSDAVLLGSTTGLQIYNSLTGLFATYSFSPPIQVSGSFFAGYGLRIDPSPFAELFRIGSLDDSESVIWRSYRISNGSGPIDLQNLGNNLEPPTFSFLFGIHMLRLNGGIFELPVNVSSCPSPTPNSRGYTALLYANGNTDQTLGSYSLNLSANQMPLGQFGFFLASTDSAPGFTPMGSQGQLCLGGSILRINASAAAVSPEGTLQWEVNVNNVDEVSALPNMDMILPGQTWHFQAWHRDMNPGSTSNTSDMAAITFQ